MKRSTQKGETGGGGWEGAEGECRAQLRAVPKLSGALLATRIERAWQAGDRSSNVAEPEEDLHRGM